MEVKPKPTVPPKPQRRPTDFANTTSVAHSSDSRQEDMGSNPDETSATAVSTLMADDPVEHSQVISTPEDTIQRPSTSPYDNVIFGQRECMKPTDRDSNMASDTLPSTSLHVPTNRKTVEDPSNERNGVEQADAHISKESIKPTFCPHTTRETDEHLPTQTSYFGKQESVIKQCCGCQQKHIGKPSLSNPVYGKWKTADEIETAPSERKLSGSSQTNVKKAWIAHEQRNTPNKASPGHRKGIRRRGHLPPVASDRECLASALQKQAGNIVNSVLFKESELPDELTADGCITEDESAAIMEIKNRKDQVRALICTVKGRDLHVLQKFLENIRKTNVDLAQKIDRSFEEEKQTLVPKTICAFCKLKIYVNVKNVVDNLYAKNFLSDALYNKIAYLDKPCGDQDEIWEQLVTSINSINDKTTLRNAFSTLALALNEKNHYKYIAEEIRTSVLRHRLLECVCKVRCVIPDSFKYNISYDPASSTMSSSSGSRESSLRTSETEPEDLTETETENEDHKAPDQATGREACETDQETAANTTDQNDPAGVCFSVLRTTRKCRMASSEDSRRQKFRQRRATFDEESVEGN